MRCYLRPRICFRGLQNYTTLKQNVGTWTNTQGFRGLQNYTTLKLTVALYSQCFRFRGLQNYTTLKPMHH